MNTLSTTGNVVGILGIATTTLQRYVNTFPEFFSDTAKIPTRGRRFTANDISTIMVIRSMYTRCEKDAAIRAALQADATKLPDNAPAPDMLSMIELATSMQKEAAENVKKIAYYRDVIRSKADTITSLQNRVKKLEDRVYDIGMYIALLKAKKEQYAAPMPAAKDLPPSELIQFINNLFGW